jgi:hypothetical protein
MGSLLATVPFSATASYGIKQLLHFSAVQLNGTAGPIPVTNQDSVQVAAYLGNVSNSGGPLNLNDTGGVSTVASLIPNTVNQTIPGFSAFPCLDPVIIGDVALQDLGFINATDASTINQELVSVKTTIPYVPIGLPVTPVGPDPMLSVGSMQYAEGSRQAARGSGRIDGPLPTASCLLSTVNIDTARPEGSSGMTDAVLALRYDPKSFDVTAADVRLGDIPLSGQGWKLQAEVNSQSGLIGVEIFSNAPIQLPIGGSLITIAMHARPVSGQQTLAGNSLSFLPDADPSGGVRIYRTSVSDAQGPFVLHFSVDCGNQTVDTDRPRVYSGETGDDGSLPLLVPPLQTALLPMALLDRAFEEAESVGQVIRERTWDRTGPLPSASSNEGRLSGVSDQVLLLDASLATQRDWLSVDSVTSEGQTGMEEGADLLGLDAFFADEEQLAGRTRTP